MDKNTGASIFGALSGYALFLGAIQFMAISLSIFKINISQALAAAVIILSALAGAGVWALLRGRVEVAGRPETGKKQFFNHTLFAISLSALCAYFLLWALAYIGPDLSWDGNVYHIPPINLWAARGYIYWIDEPFPSLFLMNGYPKGAELMSYILVRATGDNNFLNALNLVYLPLGMLGISYVAIELGARTRTALFAGLAFILVPNNVSLSITTYVDGAHSASLVCVLAGLVFAYRSLVRGKGWLYSVPVLGAGMGLTLGAKSSGIMEILIVAATLVLFSSLKGRREFMRAMIILACAGLTGFLVGGFWYARNYIMTGSPVYPVGLTILGHVIFPGSGVDEFFKVYNQVPPLFKDEPGWMRVLLAWLQCFWHWPQTIKLYDSRLGGLGFLWVLAGLPAVALAARHFFKDGKQDRDRTVMLLIAASALLFILTPLNWWPRYVIWLYGLGLPAFAWAIDEFGAKSKAARVWVSLCLAALVIEGAISIAFAAGTAYPGNFFAHPTGVLRPSNWKWPQNYIYPQMESAGMDRILAGRDPIATSTYNGPIQKKKKTSLLIKQLMMGVYSQPVGYRYLAVLPDFPTQKDLERVQKLGVKYVVWDDYLPFPEVFRPVSKKIEHPPGFFIIYFE